MTEPAPLDFTDIAAAIESQDRTDGGSKLDRVGNAALDELLRRLEDPVLAMDLPGTGLLNIASSYVKAREKQIEDDANKDTGPEQDDIDVILTSKLPTDRKKTLLAECVVVLEAKRDRILQLIEGDAL